jgi:hypothetical protein
LYSWIFPPEIKEERGRGRTPPHSYGLFAKKDDIQISLKTNGYGL